MAHANLAVPTDIKLKMVSGNISANNTTDTITMNESTDTSWLVKKITITNQDTSFNKDCQVRVSLYNLGGNTAHRYLLYDAWVPFGTSLDVIDDSTPIYLQSVSGSYDESIAVTMVGGAANGIDYSINYSEIKN